MSIINAYILHVKGNTYCDTLIILISIHHENMWCSDRNIIFHTMSHKFKVKLKLKKVKMEKQTVWLQSKLWARIQQVASSNLYGTMRTWNVDTGIPIEILISPILIALFLHESISIKLLVRWKTEFTTTTTKYMKIM